jgi:threonine synthase
MPVTYVSTRDHNNRKTASQAVLKGLAEDGGLFVPDSIPKLQKSITELGDMTYQEVAFEVMKNLLTDYTDEELTYCIEQAYDNKFDDPAIAPLSFAEGAYYIELYHGKTMAFKDIALSILPHLLTTAARKNHIKEDIVILTATSGDTGKAALAGFSNVSGTKIAVFYPETGVSPIQKHQMVTENGDNTFVAGITGNFDQAQSGVKAMFGDKPMNQELLEHSFRFSSANSINIGRLVPQIVYYVNTYVKLVKYGELKAGDPINYVVPTGNFGNILAAYYAGEMGIPINKLILASNENKVLYDFLKTGTYDKRREFHVTNSPSMDILISSNLERLIYRLTGNSDQETKQFMEALQNNGSYTISDDMRAGLDRFYGNYATEEETTQKIHDLYADTGYLIDTHTAVGTVVYDKYVAESGDNTVTAIASTASPYKFVRTVMDAIHGSDNESTIKNHGNTHAQTNSDETDSAEYELSLCDSLSAETGVPLPYPIEDLKRASVHHRTVCDPEDMPMVVKEFLGIK